MSQPPTHPDQRPGYREWHIPLARDDITLSQARADLERVSAKPAEIPLLIQLVENPRYRVPGIELFHGRVGLQQHDAIHILLGRGLLNKDEGFTIGFTMGSTRRISSIEEELFVNIASYLYPQPYRLDADDIEVFRDALRLAYFMHCRPLDNVDYQDLENIPLAAARHRMGIDKDLLRACYRLEKERYPHCPASTRLLDL